MADSKKSDNSADKMELSSLYKFLQITLPPSMMKLIPMEDIYVDQFVVGMAIGGFSGFLLARYIRKTAIVAVTGFAALQFLNYYDYIDIHWQRIFKDVRKRLDMQKKEGGIDEHDVMDLKEKLKKFLKKIPGGLGIAAGFAVAFRHF
ncbi:hypothetical protein IE077_001441 [Cardiosporidium cionae]|uniref:FUN14 family protein n=1 Tax=Cardiosporidium cionae TaxID=476202 RepID=A0ABQ7JD75_9APIC|nr:hypothetical protein IE077_001441 [Cardiosporidium cionae]|eukprot:KAF8821865.1 hypothetical protein IE077_001441 [Cardiosporidium cionae]